MYHHFLLVPILIVPRFLLTWPFALLCHFSYTLLVGTARLFGAQHSYVLPALVWWLETEQRGLCADVAWFCPVPPLPGMLLLVGLSWSSGPPTPTPTPAKSTQSSFPFCRGTGGQQSLYQLVQSARHLWSSTKREVRAFQP